MSRRRDNVVPMARPRRPRRSLRAPRWLVALPVAGLGRIVGAVALLLGLGGVDYALSPTARVTDARDRARAATECRVMKVVDGDTVDLLCAGRGRERVRLAGFDAPELYSPDCAAEWLAAQRATFALRQLLWSADLSVWVFGGQDRYGRRLATLELDGRDVARSMVAEGHGRPYGGGARGGWCA